MDFFPSAIVATYIANLQVARHMLSGQMLIDPRQSNCAATAKKVRFFGLVLAKLKILRLKQTVTMLPLWLAIVLLPSRSCGPKAVNCLQTLGSGRFTAMYSNWKLLPCLMRLCSNVTLPDCCSFIANCAARVPRAANPRW